MASSSDTCSLRPNIVELDALDIISWGLSRSPVTRVGARSMKHGCVYCDFCNGCVESPSLSKGALGKVVWAEALDLLADTEASNGLGWKQSKQNRSAYSVEGQWA